MSEENEARFQGDDTDKFESAETIVYDQTAGEEMAATIVELKAKLSAISEIVWAEEIEDAYGALNSIQSHC